VSAPVLLVVADPPEGARIARWLEEDGFGKVRHGDGSDETLAAFEADPADIVILCAGLASGDALALAHAVRARAPSASLVLVGEETGSIRTALDAMDYAADRFLRRPLSRAALRFATQSCAALGHSPLVNAPAGSVVTAQAEARPLGTRPPTTIPPQTGDLVNRIAAATSEAIEAFLHDVVEDALALPPEDPDEPEPERDGPIAPEAAPTARRAAVEPPPVWSGDAPPQSPNWREPTQILSGPVAVPEEARTGTFASEIRRHMERVEERLFGSNDSAVEGTSSADADIDLDAIGVATLPGMGDPALSHSMVLGSGSSDSFYPRNDTVVRGTSPPLPASSGDLAVEDAAFLIARLHREGLTGRAELGRGDAEKALLFEEGRLVFATSSLVADRMGDLLYREGKITRDQHARSRELVAETGRRMGEILVEMGFLKRRELLPAVRRHVEDIVYSLFGWDAGTFRVIPGAAAEDEKIRLATHPHALVLEGIRRKLGLERLRERLGPPATVLVPLARDAIARAVEEADLSPDEREAADLFDGRRTLAQVLAASRLDETSLYQLGYGLWALGLARVVAPKPAAGEGVRAPAASSTPVGGAADMQIDRERVLGKHAQVIEGDYFAVLGVRRDASAFEIRRAFEAMRRDYAGDALPIDLARELGLELREIGHVLEEAHRILRSDRTRAQYLAHLES
jgi:ActR/RegA family two-component response regulator